MPVDEKLKTWLREMKEAGMSAAMITAEADGELSGKMQAALLSMLSVIDTNSTTVFTPHPGPSFVPPTLGEDYQPIDYSGFDLAEFGSVTEQELCDALDRLCEMKDKEAAQHVRRARDLIVPFRVKAGIF